MSIDKKLIEKYHLGLCSKEEIEQVEEWLLNEEMDEEFILPLGENKEDLKKEMWSHLSEHIPSLKEQSKKQIRFSDYFSPTVWRAYAASLLILASVGVLWFYQSESQKKLAFATKEERADLNHLRGNRVEIVLGQQSNANLTMSQKEIGSLDFCGTILIQPKEDVELTVNGSCAIPSADQEKRTFRKGETYVAVNYQFNQEKELIVVEEGKLINLPPLVQREIMKQFPI